jgi:hypothetical protein
MTFLSPWMLYGLGALAAPVIIHLWQRRRVAKVRFSTLRFLKLAATKTSRSSRIEHVLLLLLRCLIFALLVLACARPVLPAKTARFFGADVPRTVVLAIDNSMSMNCRVNGITRLETAKKEALAVVEDLKPGDEVALMSVGGRPLLLIAEPTVDHQLARRMIEDIRPGEARSDFSGVFREATKIVARGSRGVRELYFLTDNQTEGWLFDASTVFDAAWKKSDLHPVIVQPDDHSPANAAVREVKIKSPFVSVGTTVSGIALVENNSTQPIRNLLEIKLGGERVARSPVEIAAGATVEIPFSFSVATVSGRWARGVASIEGDNLPDDDQFYFVVPAYRVPRVLVVEGQRAGGERLHSGYYLCKALTAGEAGAIPPKSISADTLDSMSVEACSAIFLTDIARLGDRAVVRLDRFLQGGGTVVLFPGDLASASGFSRFDFLPAKAGAVRNLPPGRLAVRVNDPAHPLFANLWDSGTPFPALPQGKIMDWKINAGAKALATFSNSAPLIILGSRGPGRVLIVNASADRAWGDFPLSPAFLPLVRQITRLSAEQAGAHTAYTVDDALPTPPNLPRDEPLTVMYPDGSRHELPAGGGAQIVGRAEQCGFYEIRSQQEGLLQTFAVNAGRRESNLRVINPAELSKIVSADTVSGLDNLKLWLAQSRGVAPLWPALLLLALAAFAAESLLSNIAAAKRSQGDEEHIKTGRLNKRRIGVSFRPEMEAKL